MFGLDTLDVGIGMALMFLFVSLIASAVKEYLESWCRARGRFLLRGISELVGEAVGAPTNGANGPVKSAVADLYNSPLISGTFRGAFDANKWRSLPSYIPAGTFARAIIGMARKEGNIADDVALTVDNLRTAASKIENPKIKGALLSALDVANADITTGKVEIARIQQELEEWYNGAMDRVAGWYKRRTQYWLFGIGLGCAVVMNIDAITVMQHLATDKTMREAVVKTAAATLNDQARDLDRSDRDKAACTEPTAAESPAAASASDRPTSPGGGATDVEPTNQCPPSLAGIQQATARMGTIAWPIGWMTKTPDSAAKADRGVVEEMLAARPAPQYRAWPAQSEVTLLYLKILLGWLITAFGVTFGAAFWFDVLNRFMVIRSTIKPDEKSPKERSKS